MRGHASMKLLYASMLLPCACGLLRPVERPQTEGRTLVLWMPGASSVQVLADWNEWGGLTAPGGVIDPSEGNMDRSNDGFWSIDISGLEGGSYRYTFLVNGHRWVRDGTNPLVTDFRGRTVSLIMVED